MRVVSIDPDILTELCNSIRKMKKLSPKEKIDFINALLKQTDALRQSDTENLVCLRCATALRGHKHESTIFRLGESGRLRVYSICHKNYFDRAEVIALPAVGSITSRRAPAKR